MKLNNSGAGTELIGREPPHLAEQLLKVGAVPHGGESGALLKFRGIPVALLHGPAERLHRLPAVGLGPLLALLGRQALVGAERSSGSVHWCPCGQVI